MNAGDLQPAPTAGIQVPCIGGGLLGGIFMGNGGLLITNLPLTWI
jgi:hypothetical protein